MKHRVLWLDRKNPYIANLIDINKEDLVILYNCLKRIIKRSAHIGVCSLFILWKICVYADSKDIINFLKQVAHWMWYGSVGWISHEVEDKDVI